MVPDAMIYTPKPALGESVGASAVWQVIVGTQALHCGELPPVLHGDPSYFVAACAFAHGSGGRAPGNHLKLWSQSASCRFATGNRVML